jgi:flagellar biosynthesis protein FliQ
MISTLSKEAIYTFLIVASPVLLAALVVGFLVSILQAITQIQEASMSFVPKLLAVFLSLIVCGSWMFTKLKTFVDHVIQFISL